MFAHKIRRGIRAYISHHMFFHVFRIDSSQSERIVVRFDGAAVSHKLRRNNLKTLYRFYSHNLSSIWHYRVLGLRGIELPSALSAESLDFI